MDRVCSLADRLDWAMHWSYDGNPPDPASAQIWIYPDSEEEADSDFAGDGVPAPLTSDQLDSVVHPSGRWILDMRFDKRALMEGSAEREAEAGNRHISSYHVERRELFEPTATLREVRGGSCRAYACMHACRRRRRRCRRRCCRLQ